MLSAVLLAVNAILLGAIAGVLLAVDMAVVPVLSALRAGAYVQIHRMLDPRFDPLMPWLSKLALVTGVAVLVIERGGVGPRIIAGIAEACLVGVALVSELVNVRINRGIDTWDIAHPPGDWSSVRARWFRANRARTILAAAGFIAAVTAAVIG
jgi:hypothetical protein